MLFIYIFCTKIVYYPVLSTTSLQTQAMAVTGLALPVFHKQFICGKCLFLKMP